MTPLPSLLRATSARAAASRLRLAPCQVAAALLAPGLALLGPRGARVSAVAAGETPTARAGGVGVEGA